MFNLNKYARLLILSAVFLMLQMISTFAKIRTFEKETAQSFISCQPNKKVIYFWSEIFQEDEEDHSNDTFQGFSSGNTDHWKFTKETLIPTEYLSFFNRRLKPSLLFILFQNLRI